MNKKDINRKKRHYRLRKKIVGTSEVPRVSVSRTVHNLSVQVIDDMNQKTLVGMATNAKEIKAECALGGNKKAAELLGEKLAGKMSELNIKKVCFDRGGNLYHGRIQVFADALRNNGIEF